MVAVRVRARVRVRVRVRLHSLPWLSRYRPQASQVMARVRVKG
jgi:hypothetical protein